METSMMETSMTVSLLAVIVVATAVLTVLTLLNAGIGPPEAPALGALGGGLVALGVALKGRELWSVLAAPVVDVVANVVL